MRETRRRRRAATIALAAVVTAGSLLVTGPAHATHTPAPISAGRIHYLTASADGKIVFASGATSNRGAIWRSNDSGVSWAEVTPHEATGHVILPPDYPAVPTLFIASDVGLWRSDDDGATWRLAAPLGFDNYDVPVSPGWSGGDHRIFFHDYKSVFAYDANSDQTALVFTIPNDDVIHSFSLSSGFPADPTVYVSTSRLAFFNPTRLYYCADGVTVCNTSTTLASTPAGGAPRLLDSKMDPGTLVAAYHTHTRSSTDNGVTWQISTNVNYSFSFFPVNDGGPGELIAAAHYPGAIFGTQEGGVYTSVDDGVTWDQVSDGTILDTHGVSSAVRLASGALIAGVWGGGPTMGVLCSTDNGATWAATC